MTDELSKVNRAYSLMDQQSYRDALAVADNVNDPSLRAAILIDAGFGAEKSGSIREGVSLLEVLLSNKEKLRKVGVLSSLLFNAANGYYAIYQLRRRRRKVTIPPNDDELRMSKSLYREAIDSMDQSSSEFSSRLFTNYANCLSQFGRGLEAIEIYGRALSVDPNNGIAAGNTGRELYSIARITGAYFHDYIGLARQFLSDSLSDEMHLKYGPRQAEDGYSQTLELIEGIVEKHEDFSDQVSPAVEPQLGDDANNYISFCRKRSLLLNAWVGDPDLAPANSDEISYGPILTDPDDETTVPELIRILNEIKEAYSTARYLLYLASRGKETIDEVSKATLYFRINTDELNSLHIGLCKSSYLRAFDVLDKVAKIAHVYFGIGKRDDHFWYVFATKQSRGQEKLIRFVAPPQIVGLQNSSLFALSDICIDFFESQHVNLKTIDHRRNLISHDYLAVFDKVRNAELEENEIDIQSLFNQTLEVLRLAKLSILYAVSSIDLAEQQKANARAIPRFYEHDHGTTSDDIPKL